MILNFRLDFILIATSNKFQTKFNNQINSVIFTLNYLQSLEMILK